MHRILRAAVAAVDPARLVANALRAHPIVFTRTSAVTVIAAGKAAWPMAHAFAAHAHVRAGAGIVAGPRGHGDLPASFASFEGGHPVPDDVSVTAGRRALALARQDGPSTLVVLLSGGASAMLAAPAEGITLDDKVRTTRSLLLAGISIGEQNCVRKHLSAIKGGHLAAFASESVTFAISDVHGPVADDPSVIGSGPTVPDPTTYDQALAIARRLDADAADLPRAVLQRLERGARGELEETPKPGDPRLRRSTYRVIGNRITAMEGAARAAQARGYAVHVIGDATCGEARLAGDRFARTAASMCRADPAPVCVIASGETTVRVRGAGRGGRNQEFALAMANALDEAVAGHGIVALAASVGTDGIDGPTDAAGALVDSSTRARAARAGLDPADALARNDTYPFFQQLDDLIVWGPTGTNVGDVHVFLT